MKRILITGSSGFLGKNLLKLISDRGLNSKYVFLTPSSKELDLTSEVSVKNYFDSNNVHYIIHGAAICGGVGLNKKRPADLTHFNSKMTINIFDAVRNHNIEYFVGLGTVCSYPMFCPVPFNEDDMWTGKSEKTNRGYGESKKLLITELQSHIEQYSTSGIVLVPTNMFGMFDHFDDLQNNHVIPALITKFIAAKENDAPEVLCWGDGTPTRDFIDAAMVCEAIISCVENKVSSYDPINLGSGTDISIKDLAEMISKLIGYTGKITFTNEVSNGQLKRKLDTSRARDLLGWLATTSLRDGLVKTIEWYRANKNNLTE